MNCENSKTGPGRLQRRNENEKYCHACLLGSYGSVLIQDLDVRPRLTPWMGGLFVVKEHRGRGVATGLIHRLIKEARRLSVKRLCLWTPSAEVLHTNLGWVRLERFDYCGHEISVMQRELRGQTNNLS